MRAFGTTLLLVAVLTTNADAQTWSGRLLIDRDFREYEVTLSGGSATLIVTAEQDADLLIRVNGIRENADLIQIEPAEVAGGETTFALRAEASPQLFLVEIRSLSKTGGSYRMFLDSASDVWVRDLGQRGISSGPGVETPTDGYAAVEVFYATDREPIPSVYPNYGADRSGDKRLRRGRLSVNVPRYKSMSLIERTVAKFLGTGSPQATVTGGTELSEEGFRIEMEALRNADKGDALVFIHGFRVTFRDAIYRTAQLTYDLGFTGKPIAFSWPSEGRLDRYGVDETNCDVSIHQLEAFLEELTKLRGLKRIHLVAHSMGNMALLGALDRLYIREPKARQRFTHVVLTAPDVDVDKFLLMEKSLRALAQTVTLYVSSNDLALNFSRSNFHKYRRLGDAKPAPVITNGVDTIDVSMVKTDFIGHSYYQGEGSVVADIYYLINKDLKALDRRLGRVGEPPQRYFVFPR